MYLKLGTVAVAVLIIGAGSIVIALVSGLRYEQAQRARDREQFPQIGRSVDIGGRMLNIYCSGSGQPTVILESGAPWALYEPREMLENGAPRPGYSWVSIQRELAKHDGVLVRSGGFRLERSRPLPARQRVPGSRFTCSPARGGGPAALCAGGGIVRCPRCSRIRGLLSGRRGRFGVCQRCPSGSSHQDTSRQPENGAVSGFVGHSQDAMAQVFDEVGTFSARPAESSGARPGPEGMTSSEWNTIWHLTQSSKARSALMQEIGAWERSTAEARVAGSLSDRPLIVLSAENAEVASEYPGVWIGLQTDLARLSTRGKRMVSTSGDELIYQAPDAVVAATRQVVGDVRQVRRLR